MHKKDASVQNIKLKCMNFGMNVKPNTRTQLKASKLVPNDSSSAYVELYCSQHHLIVSDDLLFLSNAVIAQEWSTVDGLVQLQARTLKFTSNYAFIPNLLLKD